MDQTAVGKAWETYGCCVYILSLNLLTLCMWHGCYRCHPKAMLTVILNSTWWREKNRNSDVSGITKWVSSVTCVVESYMQAHNYSRRLNNEHLKTNCLHTSFLYWSDLAEFCSCSGSHVSVGHTLCKHLLLHVFSISKFSKCGAASHNNFDKTKTYKSGTLFTQDSRHFFDLFTNQCCVLNCVEKCDG